jgi:putative oxidoreductase
MSHFDFTNGMTILRMICGFFFLPHALGKFTAKEAAFGFLHKAGFRPSYIFGYIAMTVEVTLATCLILGFFTKPMAWLACVYLVVCAAAVIKVERKWLWHIGGCEFPVFWAICCGIVATSY